MSNNPYIEKIIRLSFLAQFVNFLEFFLITPLAPYFTDDLGIQTSEVGWILGSYSLAAAVSSILSSIYIDGFDRKKILLTCFLGITAGTTICILSYDFKSLIVSRIIAGIFGGPATAIIIAILSDFVPNHQRGKAMGRVMAAFPLAGIIGAPVALECARLSTWQTSYSIVLLLELICVYLIMKILPNITDHIDNTQDSSKKLNKLINIAFNKNYFTGFLAAFLIFTSFFLVVPNLANLLLFNFHLPPQYLSLFFFLGGSSTFIMIKVVSWLCDKYNSTLGVTITTITFCISIVITHLLSAPGYVLWIFTILFMVSVSPRVTAVSVATSKLPVIYDRAGFLSIQNSAQNIATSLGGFLSGVLLTQGDNKEIIGIEYTGLVALIAAVFVPFLVYKIEKITCSYK